MDIMLPHRYDRYRLLGLLFEHLTHHATQKALGDKLKLNQSTISRSFTLQGLEEKGLLQHTLKKRTLMTFASKALSLGYREISLLLWLATGNGFKPLSDSEIAEHCLQPTREQLEESVVFQKSPNSAYWAAIDWLKAVISHHDTDSSVYELKTWMTHGNSLKSRLGFYHKLLEIEARPGQRLLVSKFPSILTSSDVDKFDEELLRLPKADALLLRGILARRHEIFIRNLETYGERAIHSISSLQRFVSHEFDHPVDLQERRNRVKNLIAQLNDFKKFRVGLAEVEPEIEIAIKSTEAAMIRGTARQLSNHPMTLYCGPNYLFWIDKEGQEPCGVLAFFLDFEDEWRKLQQTGKTDSDYVVEKLKAIITDAEANDHTLPKTQ